MINKKDLFPIGIGTWGIGGFMEPVYGNEEKEIDAIRYSIKKGQNHIDTAEMYGNGHAEEIVGQAIKGLNREKLFIASKVHRNYTKGKDVLKSTERILKRLQIKYLNMLYLHSYWEDENMLDYLEGVNQAVKRGLAKSIAVSNFNTEQLKWVIANWVISYLVVPSLLTYTSCFALKIPFARCSVTLFSELIPLTPLIRTGISLCDIPSFSLAFVTK